MVEKTLDGRKCKARSSRTGKPCQHWAIKGGTVCLTHGGRAPQVKRKAQERLEDLIDPDRVLREWAKLAYLDPTVIYDDQGRLKPVSEWPAEVRGAVGHLQVVRGNVDKGDGQFDDVLTVKFWDKAKALEALSKHLGLLVEKVHHAGELVIKWQQ